MNPSGFVKTSDGLELAWRAWPAAHPKGVIVIVHGLAEHGMRYAETAGVLADAGWSIYSVDLRAHGLSPDVPGSKRVHVNRFSDYLEDVEAMVTLAHERHPALPLFILGHSMGGLISLNYLLTRPERVSGGIISSPALGTHPDFQPPKILKILVGLFSVLMPRKLFPTELETDSVCRDPKVVQDYVNDPLVTDKVSARWYAEIIKAIKAAYTQAPKLQLPVLLMQSGADRLVDPGGPARWAELTPPGKVDLVIWPEFFHEMLHDPDRGQVWQKTLNWLDSVLDVVDVDLPGKPALDVGPGHSNRED